MSLYRSHNEHDLRVVFYPAIGWRWHGVSYWDAYTPNSRLRTERSNTNVIDDEKQARRWARRYGVPFIELPPADLRNPDGSPIQNNRQGQDALIAHRLRKAAEEAEAKALWEDIGGHDVGIDPKTLFGE
jgi:hypothetical protein